MAFALNDGEKFAYIAFNNVGIKADLPKSIDLGGDTWILRTPPSDIDNLWQEWLGSIRSKQIAESNLFIIAKCPSLKPKDLDHENNTLLREADSLFYGLLLQGIPEYVAAFKLTGARTEGKFNIRNFGRLDTYYRTEGSPIYRIGQTQCMTARQAADGLKLIHDDKDFQRLKRGFRALVRGIKEYYPEDRLHEFVRSLEALVKPKMLKTKKQFVHRCQTFCAATTSAAKVLGECFEIRNKVEHMHPFEEALEGYQASKAQEIGLQRLRQIEALTLAAYLKICTSHSHRAIFQTDSDIEAFWSKKDHERAMAWGERLNIEEVS
jgi:hypothetical protein